MNVFNLKIFIQNLKANFFFWWRNRIFAANFSFWLRNRIFAANFFFWLRKRIFAANFFFWLRKRIFATNISFWFKKRIFAGNFCNGLKKIIFNTKSTKKYTNIKKEFCHCIIQRTRHWFLISDRSVFFKFDFKFCYVPGMAERWQCWKK